MNQKDTRLTARMPTGIKDAMRKFCKVNQVSLSWLVRRSWTEFLKSVKGGKVKL
jgi:hypothetical protein